MSRALAAGPFAGNTWFVPVTTLSEWLQQLFRNVKFDVLACFRMSNQPGPTLPNRQKRAKIAAASWW